MESKQDVSSIMVVFHCLQMWINCCEAMKDHLGHSGIISNIILLHLKLIQAFPLLDDVCNSYGKKETEAWGRELEYCMYII